MPLKCRMELRRLDNGHIENENDLYIRPKSANNREKLHVHLHLIREGGRLTQVLLTFPDFSSSDMSGYINDHVNFAKVSPSGEWTFEERPVFHALAAMQASANQVNRQMWKVASLPSHYKDEADRIPEQVKMAGISSRYCELVMQLLAGVQEAAGQDLSSLNAGL
jgi:hypothetical protein